MLLMNHFILLFAARIRIAMAYPLKSAEAGFFAAPRFGNAASGRDGTRSITTNRPPLNR
jgi:hypothetical protein